MLSGAERQIEILTELNFLNYRITIGLINIVIALSLWSKKTRYMGVFLGTAYLGGAIASELSIGDAGLVPGLTMLLLWVIQKIQSQTTALIKSEIPAPMRSE